MQFVLIEYYHKNEEVGRAPPARKRYCSQISVDSSEKNELDDESSKKKYQHKDTVKGLHYYCILNYVNIES